MRGKSQFISQWTSSGLIMLVFVAASIAPASAQNEVAQPAQHPVPDAPSFDTAALVPAKSPGLSLGLANPSIHSFGNIDLKPDDVSPIPPRPADSDIKLNFSDLPDSPYAAASSHSASTPSSGSMVVSNARQVPEAKVRWRAAIQESLFLVGIGHTFDLTTEAGTRDALYGPWLNDYLHSVSELRGWSDSDRFMAPYASHPIQGSAFGFIERQNDPRYRKVQWGDGREYFMSLLHSMAYAAFWEAEWKIGPASEASIGNVMLHASPGFICLTDTPTLGTIAMMAEDIADRYLITGLENRTTNRLLIVLARSFLNPGRSTAQAMALRYPWDRDYRLRLTGEEYQMRKQLVAEYKAGGEKPFVYVKPPGPVFEKEYPKEADIELEAFPVYERLLGSNGLNNCVGGGGSGATRLNPEFQLLGEVSGCSIMGFPAVNQSGDMLFYGGGLRWTPLAAHKVSPYMQVMFGGRKVTREIDDLALRKQLMEEWDNGGGTLPHYPKRSDWSVEYANNGPSLGFGSGFDWVVTRAFAWRLANVEYFHTWMGNVGAIQPQNALRITTGAVLRIGTW
jgi:hypothetical protein